MLVRSCESPPLGERARDLCWIIARVNDGNPSPAADTTWLIDVTDADVRAARRAWAAARDADPTSDRARVLHASYERIVRTQARQLSERLQRAR